MTIVKIYTPELWFEQISIQGRKQILSRVLEIKRRIESPVTFALWVQLTYGSRTMLNMSITTDDHREEYYKDLGNCAVATFEKIAKKAIKHTKHFNDKAG